MRSNARSPRVVARTGRPRRSLGSRPVRLAEAGKQLEILLEDVDLDAEPELGRALTEAVVAVDQAADLVGRGGERQPPAPDRPFEESRVDDGTAVRGDERGAPPVESGGLQFVGGSGAE